MASPAVRVPAWAPLRRPVFRALWIAQFVANTGTWVQTVGAQWLMGDLGGTELDVALVQTATTLPVFLLVVPAGALGDILDRRRLLLTGQAVMLVGAAGLTLCTYAELTAPWSLLLLIALMGIGQALSLPSFQAIQPELVSHAELPQAALLNGANMNIARAVGPALGGVLIAAVGPAATFAVNMVSFVAVLVVLYRWQRPPDHRPLGAEHVVSATRAGLRYLRSAPLFATVLARSALFIVFASGLWALLPAVARGPLGLGPGGYGALLGVIGLGAVAGAVVVPRIRRRFGTGHLVTAGYLAYAAAVAVVGVSHSTPVVTVALALAGAAWIAVQATLSASAQLLLPAWIRARALSYYQLVFMGGQALGAIGWGAVAAAGSLPAAFLIPAAGLVAGALLGGRWLRLSDTPPDLAPAEPWPHPPGQLSPEPAAGPVLVQVEWPVPADNVDAFVATMRQVSRSRRRTGATMWGLFRDTEDPTRFVETFVVTTWQEHLRQHLERGTMLDRELEQRAHNLIIPGREPRARHLIWADPQPE